MPAFAFLTAHSGAFPGLRPPACSPLTIFRERRDGRGRFAAARRRGTSVGAACYLRGSFARTSRTMFLSRAERCASVLSSSTSA